MGDDAVNTAHDLIRVARGLAGHSVEVSVIAGVAHTVEHLQTSATTVARLDAIAGELETSAGTLRGCAAALSEAT